MESPYTGTQAISRAVAILKALGDQRSALTPQQISVLVRLNRSTVYRILSALEHDGLVALDETGRYILGPELVALGSSALRQINLRQVALPVLQELARRSGETVDLEILHGQPVMVLEEIIGDHLLNTSSNIGTLYPAHCTATGKLLLAYLPEDALATVLA